MSASKLVNAWKEVVSRDAVFRTVFVQRPGDTGIFDQVILDNVKPQVEHIFAEPHLIRNPHRIPSPRWSDGETHHRFTVLQVPCGETYILLEYSRALIDRLSHQTVFQDLSHLYNGGKHSKEVVSFEALTSFTSRISTPEGTLSWEKV
ncbi:hypothetical protein BJ170DRAFT_619291 [Xylariales sp. AK1849]|nr:hypothetical protein BJ170DRAFT_619291 [Xylariales sp. AK1849]